MVRLFLSLNIAMASWLAADFPFRGAKYLLILGQEHYGTKLVYVVFLALIQSNTMPSIGWNNATSNQP
jgi:hypothetical protein